MTDNEDPRYIRDGKVAVLYSPGYGAGWSTWNTSHPELLFDPKIVAILLDENLGVSATKYAVREYAERKYPNIYLGSGLDTLTIMWLAIGSMFRVHEYDGDESIVLHDEDDWRIA